MAKKLTTKGHQAYMSGKEGPFMCSNCEYFVGPAACNNDKIIGYANKQQFGLTVNAADMANVDPNGCSDEFKKR